ncbi:MAG: hypothetical protein A2512_09470 [Deltaproteobacteria bacterium RIFOXYD12_FULL_56_24]|nr:MAG: hypothetical protein A2512_09470 [Deltaproteobacteria bacterium RIFOXYD12_FULL_56_24]
MAVTLTLRDSKSGLALADPVQGMMVDSSRHGTRLSIHHIHTGSYHLFYDCSDDPAKVIHLEIIDGEEGEKLIIPVQPVWFDHVFSGPVKHFELGLKFLVPPDDFNVIRLQAYLASLHPREGGWLKRFFSSWLAGISRKSVPPPTASSRAPVPLRARSGKEYKTAEAAFF